MKKIKIAFCDMPNEFDINNNFIVDTLKERYEVELSDDPDFVFYSVFSIKHFMYRNCVKIFLSGEPIVPNFNDCDYAIGYIYMDFGDRYLRVANMLATSIGAGTSPAIQIRDKVTPEMADRRFCNFIYSNATKGNGAVLRMEFCKELMKYKHIDCPGTVLHNMDTDELEKRWVIDQNGQLNVLDNNWQTSKLDFQGKYKFTIAFENLDIPGMTTEKLLNPFEAYSVPIYWGNPEVAREFNTKAFINCNDYDNNFNKIIERIIKLDNDPEQYLQMLREKPFRDDYPFDDVKRFREYLYMIIERGNHPIRHPEAAEGWETLSALLVYRWGHTYETVYELSQIDFNSNLWKLMRKIQKLGDSKWGYVPKKCFHAAIKCYRAIKP